MQKVTKKMIEQQFNQFVKKNNLDPDKYFLDYYQPGGNPYTWAIMVKKENGGVSYLHSMRRYTSREIYEILYFHNTVNL